MKKCYYGCGKPAKHILLGKKRIKKPCCSSKWQQCPASRKRQSEIIKKVCAKKGYVHSSRQYFLKHGHGWNKGVQGEWGKYASLSDAQLFVKDSPTARSCIRQEAIRRGVLKEICSECGNKGLWRGKKIVIQLHHKNGIDNDNRKENLDMLCPNCHCATDTWANPNNRRKL